METTSGHLSSINGIGLQGLLRHVTQPQSYWYLCTFSPLRSLLGRLPLSIRLSCPELRWLGTLHQEGLADRFSSCGLSEFQRPFSLFFQNLYGLKRKGITSCLSAINVLTDHQESKDIFLYRLPGRPEEQGCNQIFSIGLSKHVSWGWCLSWWKTRNHLNAQTIRI